MLGVLLFAAAAASAQTLRISAIPDESPTELIRKFTPLADYLSKELGVEVKFTPLVDYAATVEALAAGKLDLVWYGGFTHVQARIRTKGKAVPLVMRIRDLNFRSKFITRKGSGIKALADLKGKTFAFGSVSSTSGHLMPRFFLKRAGLIPEKNFAKFSFSGAHDATAKWVEAGKVDAGVLNEAVWEKLVKSGKIDTSKVTVFYTTPGYVDYNWTARGDLDRRLLSRLTGAFLKLNPDNPAHKKILALQRATGYVVAFPGDFKGIEDAAEDAGLLKKLRN
ncbi:MAG: putative selenate ABC transporter substrate-binding protein [bacterium]|nr:putative selenate ABC transporter substrate-binding protein [bacterium]